MRALFVNRLSGGECLGRMPLGILCLSAALKRAGHEAAVADACRPEEVYAALESFAPDVLLYSVRTGYHRAYTKLNRQLKARRPEALSIFGGPHATFYPQMLEADPAVDAVCVGEGEEALSDFMDRLEAGGDWERTPNFWARRGGVIHRNPVRPLSELDALPEPDRGLLDGHPAARGFPIRSFIASRGCPYDCSYCFNKAFADIYEGKGGRVRLPSVRRFVGEIARELEAAPFESVQFEDDIFGLAPRWLEEFATEYAARVGLPFSCNVRAELVTERMAGELARAGCASVWMGLEAGDETVRRELLLRPNSDAVTARAIGLFQSRGIKVSTENIIGLPGTTLEQDLLTLRLNLALKPDYLNCSIYQPYPRTALGAVAREQGLFSGDYDELGDFYEGTSLKVPHKRELENLQELFAPTLLLPALYPALPFLIRLPLQPLYRLLNLGLKVLTLTGKLYKVPLRPRHLRHLAQLLSRPLPPARAAVPAPAGAGA